MKPEFLLGAVLWSTAVWGQSSNCFTMQAPEFYKVPFEPGTTVRMTALKITRLEFGLHGPLAGRVRRVSVLLDGVNQDVEFSASALEVRASVVGAEQGQDVLQRRKAVEIEVRASGLDCISRWSVQRKDGVTAVESFAHEGSTPEVEISSPRAPVTCGRQGTIRPVRFKGTVLDGTVLRSLQVNGKDMAFRISKSSGDAEFDEMIAACGASDIVVQATSGTGSRTRIIIPTSD